MREEEKRNKEYINTEQAPAVILFVFATVKNWRGSSTVASVFSTIQTVSYN